MNEDYYEGRRLSYGGNLCTVRYYGEVHDTKGDWLGIEWDDPTRGKHSGDHRGVKYFRCLTSHPTAGSFVRPTRPSDTPNGFVDAIRLKYASELEGEQANPNGSLDTTNDVIRISGKTVEEVGFDKIRAEMANLQALRVVILDTLCMCRPQARSPSMFRRHEDQEQEYTRDVQDTSPNIVDLDLSCNLFEEWNEAVEICKQLRGLRSLQVNGNRFRSLSSGLSNAPFDITPFISLKSLGLDNTLLPWDQVISIASTCPVLTSLSVAGNEYKNLSTCSELPLLESLNLEGNNLTSFHDVAAIVKFTKLHTLILKNNAIANISPNSMARFNALRSVDLAFNAVKSWDFVDRLSEILPNLEVLRLSHNPLYDGPRKDEAKQAAADVIYMLTVARVGTLKQLNYSEITLNERQNAETFYLSRIVAELSFSGENDAPLILQSHSRWNELCQKYGEPVIRRKLLSAVDPNSLEARLIKCSFILDEKIDTKIQCRNVTCEVPKSLSIYSVLSLVGKKFNLQPLSLRLVWQTSTIDDSEKDHFNEMRSMNEVQNENSQSGLLKGEVLVPRTRHIGTWIEGPTATITIESSKEDIQRREKTHSLCSLMMRNGFGV